MAGPLEGIKIIDLSAVVAGPFCSQILADQGAIVIKIEPVSIGDAARTAPFKIGDISSLFASCNRGKRSVALDLKDSDDLSIVRALVRNADVLLENFRPGVCQKLGLGPDDMLKLNPDLVYVSITGFGSKGPYSEDRAYDPIIQALTGVISIQRHPSGGERDLVRTVIADKSTSVFAAQAITAALFARATGRCRGQHIEISLLSAMLYFLWPDVFAAMTFSGEGVVPGRPLYEVLSVQEVADGQLVYYAQSDSEYEGLLSALGKSEWWEEPQFRERSLRHHPKHFQNNKLRLDSVFLEKRLGEIVKALRKNGVPAAPVLTLEEALLDDHIVDQSMVIETQLPSVETFRFADHPSRFSVTNCNAPHKVESLGESTNEIKSGLS